jgi:ubiquinone/menaquinone biosynthesis C-methylase UbiE
MLEVQRSYIPAAGRDWSLPLYDPIVKLLGGDAARRALIVQAGLEPTDRALEIGCGTGALLIEIAHRHPGVVLTGLDPDPKALARAARKALAISTPIRLDRGFADDLPYDDASFDRVFSCFMFHHLRDESEKVRTLREVRRVLKTDGRLELLDFTQPAPGSGIVSRWVHSSHRLNDNTEARVRSLMAAAGFANADVVRHGRMLFALRTAYYRARA